MKERIVDKDIRLVPYHRDAQIDALSLSWYQDASVCKQVDNRDDLYDLDLLHRMYDYLCAHGVCYFIEYKGKLVGDLSLLDNEEVTIVVCKEYQNQHIGRRCIREMEKLAAEKGMHTLKANVYSFNQQSQRMFESLGFSKVEEEWYQLCVGESRPL